MPHHIHSVQTFIRVVYTDGVVAGIMAPPAEVSPAVALPHDVQARQLLNQQSQTVLMQFATVGAAGLHATAVASSKTAAQHEAPRPKNQEHAEHGGEVHLH